MRSTASPPTGAWVHLAAVYDRTAGTVRLYVGGVLQNTAAAATTWNAAGPLLIGEAKENSLPRWWAGDIDDVRVYQGVLSASQIGYLAAL